MPQTPSQIDHAVQRCRELAEEIKRANGRADFVTMAVALVEPLSLVLAELERLREAARASMKEAGGG